MSAPYYEVPNCRVNVLETAALQAAKLPGRPRHEGNPKMRWLSSIGGTRNSAICVVALTYLTLIASNRADEAEYARIRAAMNKLGPLVGTWNTVVRFFDKEGVTEEVGTYTVSRVLDNTYPEFIMERHKKENPERNRKIISYVTFNPKSNQYDTTYFYARSALRVTETGEYDDATNEFRTTCFIPLEDGVNDETVRTITSLKEPNKILYRHYSRRSPKDTSERMDLEIALTRAH